MEVKLKKHSRSEAIFEYLKTIYAGDARLPKKVNDVVFIESGIINRLCGYNSAKHTELKMIVDTSFLAGLWFGKTFPNKIEFVADKKPDDKTESYIG